MPTWYQNLRKKTCSLRLRAFTPGLTPGVLSPISDSDGEMALSEERNAGLKIHAQAIDLPGLDQLGCLKHLGRCDALRGPDLIVCSPGRWPPVFAHRVRS